MELTTNEKAMVAKGYRHAIDLLIVGETGTGNKVRFYFKTALDVGPFLRENYPTAKMIRVFDMVDERNNK